jgi:DNA-binding transcriptional LysR family regulator
MDLQQIKYFLELSRELHFWNTSEKMFITQSALSRQIKALEEELGVKLFERNKRNVKLTAAGAFLRDEWQKLLDQVNGIHRYARQIQEGKYGSLSIAYPGSIAYGFLPEVLLAISKELPELHIELLQPEDVVFDNLLLNYEIDLAFRREASGNPVLTSHCLYSENFALVVPKDHRLTSKNFKGLHQLTDEKFIISGLHHKTYYVESLQAIFTASNFTPKVHIESDYGSTILSLVAKGLGVSIMPVSYEFSANPGVRFIRLPHQTKLFATWRRDDTNPALQNVVKLAQKAVPGFTGGKNKL